jgi:nicotinamidase-related amidase
VVDAAAFVSRVAGVIEAARQAGVRIFYGRHMSLPIELAGVSQLWTAMAWQRVDRIEDVESLFLPGSPGWEIVPEVAPHPTEAVFDKLGMSLFVGTPLDMALRDCGISAFAIVGAVLEIGIEPTVRHGADLGYIPVVVADACGVVEREAGERALASLAYAKQSLQTDAATLTGILS